MEGLGCSKGNLKKTSDIIARNWQDQVQKWLNTNNLTANQDFEQCDNNKTIPTVSPQLNGAFKANQRHSGSDDGHNYPSSSSQEVESPDSQRANQRSIDHQSNHQPFLVRELSGESSSPSQLEAQNDNSVESNDNLSIDPTEVTPVNQVQESPVKDHFSASLPENMFKTTKVKEPLNEKNMWILREICHTFKLLPQHYPEYLKNYWEGKHRTPDQNTQNDCTRSLNGEMEKSKDFTHIPSTSKQGGKESSGRCLGYKPDWDKVKQLRSMIEPFYDGKNLPSTSQTADESSRNCSGFNNDRNRQHINSRVKLEQQSTQDGKNSSSVSQLRGVEYLMKIPLSQHYKKKKFEPSSQSVIKANELKEEQQLSINGKSKHLSRTEFVNKGKETAQSSAKTYEFKDEGQTSRGVKMKSDPKRVCAMASEARNCEKNLIKKRDSPDESAMLAVTSSKKERTSVYHGGRKSVSSLKEMCCQTLVKAIRQNPDPLKFIYKDVDFAILEPVLFLISPDKLQKIEDKFKTLRIDTDKVWLFYCDKKFKHSLHLKKHHENWRTFYYRCCVESEEKLRNVTASISASLSKAKPERQIKLTTVNGPPTKRPKVDNAMVAKNHINNAAIKLLPNSCQPSISRPDVPVPPKGLPNHNKPSCRTIKKDAPLMHKAKKTRDQLHRIHRN